MIIAARSSFIEHENIPYVTDGLVAWWDGIWNAGIGVHDTNATKWVDLVDGKEVIPQSGVRFDSNSLRFPSGASVPGTTSSITSLYAVQVEVVFAVDAVNGEVNNETLVLTIPDGKSRYGLAILGRGGYAYFTMSAGGRIYSTSILLSGDDPASLSYTRANVSSYEGWSTFFNGSPVGLSRNTSSIGTDTILTMGGRNPGQKRLIGRIHCVRLYNRALTAAEIAANYAVDKVRFNLP